MARKKSLNELREQYKRIIDSGDWNRIAKASEILTRYEKKHKENRVLQRSEQRNTWSMGKWKIQYC